MLGLERGVLLQQQVVRLLLTLEAAVGFGQAVLQEAFEAGLGIALQAAATVLVLLAALAAAEAVVEEQAGEGERRGDDRAGSERVDKGVRFHERVAPRGLRRTGELLLSRVAQ